MPPSESAVSTSRVLKLPALPLTRMQRCWMCDHVASDEVRDFHTFAVREAHVVDTLSMARYMHDQLRSNAADEVAADEAAAGESDCEVLNPEAPPPAVPSVEEINTHLRLHVLHPRLRTAHVLRSLVDLSENLREVVVSRAEDDSPLIDVRTAAVYLKVVSELMQVYRTADPSKMLFSTTE